MFEQHTHIKTKLEKKNLLLVYVHSGVQQNMKVKMKSYSVYVSGKLSGIRGQQAAGIRPNVSVLAVVEKHSPLCRPEQS